MIIALIAVYYIAGAHARRPGGAGLRDDRSGYFRPE